VSRIPEKSGRLWGNGRPLLAIGAGVLRLRRFRETSGNMLWFEHKLGRHGHRLRLGNPAKTRASETRSRSTTGAMPSTSLI
jgi:hypothetical protein